MRSGSDAARCQGNFCGMRNTTRLPRCAPEARRDDIIRKASELFLSNGFGATSMSTVARAIGGSKATLYKYFPTKEALFAAVIEENARDILGPMQNAASSADNPRAFLIAVGQQLLAGLYHPRAVSLARVVIGDCSRSPKIGHDFFSIGPEKAREVVVKRLLEFVSNGNLSDIDVSLATDDFFSLLRGEQHFKLMLGIISVPDEHYIRMHVERVVDFVTKSWSFKG